MLLRAFAMCCLTGLLATASSAWAGMTPARVAPSEARLVAAGCGLGFFRDAAGACADALDKVRRCPGGYFPLTFPNGNHYRCVPTEWQYSRGWLMNLFGG
ncbi:MAG: hypothetical protein ACLQE9_18290 [Roseiarcus sp.]